LPADDDPLAYAHELIAKGQPAEAVQFLRERIEAGRGGLLARLALARALQAAGEPQAGLAEAREANTLNPNIAEAVLLLGEMLRASGHLPAAIAEFQRTLRLEPRSSEARFQLGRAWASAGEAGKALEQYAQLSPATVPGLADRIADAKAMLNRPRSDPGYVRHLFDQFSADYDHRMRAQLSYRAPEILRELADLVMSGAHDLVALDLGCGTGFAGEVFADIARAIDGIDLSPAMIEKARQRQIYRELVVGDIETAPDGGVAYDLVLAADTLVYLGDLAPTFAAVARRLRVGGFFLFTVEALTEGDFALGPKRRWQHSDNYLRRSAAASGFDLAGIVSCSPRSEANVPIAGLAGALIRTR